MTKRSISLIVGDKLALVIDEWGCMVEVLAEKALSDEEQLEIILRVENEIMRLENEAL